MECYSCTRMTHEVDNNSHSEKGDQGLRGCGTACIFDIQLSNYGSSEYRQEYPSKFCRRRIGKRREIISVAVLSCEIFSPPWYIWSMGWKYRNNRQRGSFPINGGKRIWRWWNCFGHVCPYHQ